MQKSFKIAENVYGSMWNTKQVKHMTLLPLQSEYERNGFQIVNNNSDVYVESKILFGIVVWNEVFDSHVSK